MLPEHDPFSPITLDALDAVTGGRYTQGTPPADPALLQGIAQLGKAVESVGQGLIAQKQQASETIAQLAQRKMQMSRGG